MPAMIEPWIDAVKGGVHKAVASFENVAPETTNMPSLRTLSKLAFGGAQVLLGGGQRVVGEYTQSCPLPQLSCHNTTVVENLCCFNAPGGQILQVSVNVRTACETLNFGDTILGHESTNRPKRQLDAARPVVRFV